MSYAVVCHKCGKKTEGNSTQVGLRDECACGADLHVCMNCTHYDAGSYNECKEPVAERVREKDRANFCDHFSPSGSSKTATGPQKQDLRAAAEALFKKK